jgi:hypothetical protein
VITNSLNMVWEGTQHIFCSLVRKFEQCMRLFLIIRNSVLSFHIVALFFISYILTGKHNTFSLQNQTSCRTWIILYHVIYPSTVMYISVWRNLMRDWNDLGAFKSKFWICIINIQNRSFNIALECEVFRNSDLSVYRGWLVNTHLLTISLTVPL